MTRRRSIGTAEMNSGDLAHAINGHSFFSPSLCKPQHTSGIQPPLQTPEEREAQAWFENDLVARFVLDLGGHVIRTNQRGRELTASGLVGSGALLCATHRNRPEFDALLARIAERRQSEGRILFRAGNDDWCVLKLLHTPASPDRVFAALCPIKPIPAERIEMLRPVFGLTRSETAVLVHLTTGEAPKEIGRQLDMSVHTVRAHLRSLCMRMGVKGINGALRLSFQLSN